MNNIVRGSWPSQQAVPPVEEIHGPKEIQTKDYTGRIITTFEGSPKTWMRQFEGNPPRRVASIRTRS
jgi:hypothetical protein